MKVAIRDEEYIIALDIKDDIAEAAMSNDTVKQKLLNVVNKKYGTNFKLSDTEILNLKGKHLCKYCGDVANGPDEDVLCEDCRYTFGHAFYSEL